MTATPDALPEIDSVWNFDDVEGSEGRFRSLLDRARASGDSTYLAELLSQIARALGLLRRFDEAHATLDEVESLLPSAAPRAQIRYMLERGRVYNTSSQEGEARPLFSHAWELACAEGEDFYAVDAAHMMAIVEPLAEQLERNERAMDLAQNSADPRARGWLGSLYNNAGWTYQQLERYEDALATFSKGLAWQRQADKQAEARIAAWTVGRALRSLRRYEEALEMQRQNARTAESAGESDGYIEEELGECLLALDRGEEARDHFARAFVSLSQGPWLKESERERLERLERLGTA